MFSGETMMNVPKFVRVNVHNLPYGVLQTTYYAHSAEMIGDSLVVDVRVDSPISISSTSCLTLNNPITTKMDLAPLRRPINLRLGSSNDPVIVYDTEVEETEVENTDIDEDQTQDAQGQANIPLHDLIASDEEEEEEETQETIPQDHEDYKTAKKRRASRNRDAHWVQKRRKTRSDKGKPRGIECDVCMNHRELLHTCKVCKHSFCKFCFNQLVDNDYATDVCSVCKRNF